MKRYFGFFAALTLATIITLAPAVTVVAFDGSAQSGVNAARGQGVPTNFANGDGSLVQTVINTLLYAIGVISVIMLIVGGFRYVISGGQKDAVTDAKNTILYAIVGLLVALFAYAIVRFILQVVTGSGNTTDV